MISNPLFIEFKSELLKIKDKKKLENAYYEKLSKCLKSGKYKTFELLIEASIDFDIFIDITKITDRFEIISKLLLNCVDKISTGYQTSALGEIIDILRLSNKYNILERQINDSEKRFLINFKEKNKLFLENLNDLFKKPSDSFILYICKVIPQDFYNYFISGPISFFPDYDGLMDYIKNSFFNQYTVYGLNVRNLSPEDYSNNGSKFTPLEKFLDDLQNKLKENQDNGNRFIEIKITYKYQIYYYDTEEEHEQLVEKIHLVSPKNILRFKTKILDKENYNFYSLSMVILGGLGPQGLGFTYSTPKGEVIEICSDQSESEAIIIKYKQYLKRRFLEKLEKELKNYGVDDSLRNKIIKLLSDVLNQKELIHYYKKEAIIKKITGFLENIEEFQQDFKSELQDLISKISAVITIILRRIELRDQYITRINLVAENKIKPEDVAKLTSLKGKSHYDVLRERFFFQYIVDWFYDLYINKKIKTEK
ncbi:MAG: hypothetical protein ACFE9S_17070 [Candidatus Hermodarchaeota archaeon]